MNVIQEHFYNIHVSIHLTIIIPSCFLWMKIYTKIFCFFGFLLLLALQNKEWWCSYQNLYLYIYLFLILILYHVLYVICRVNHCLSHWINMIFNFCFLYTVQVTCVARETVNSQTDTKINLLYCRDILWEKKDKRTKHISFLNNYEPLWYS